MCTPVRVKSPRSNAQTSALMVQNVPGHGPPKCLVTELLVRDLSHAVGSYNDTYIRRNECPNMPVACEAPHRGDVRLNIRSHRPAPPRSF